MKEDFREALNGFAIAVVAALLVAAFCRADDADDEIAEIQRQCLARNNELRAARGLRPHRANAALNAAAQDHAAFMAKTGSFSHYSNGGPGGRAAKHGFGAGVRENIAYGYQSVQIVFGVWHGSGGHYANMMSATTDAGFGLAYGAGGTPYWVAVYGTPPPIPDDAPPAETPANVSPETTVQRPGLFGWLLRRRG